ncbi:hypothetical protein OEA41_006449 [Lepraria neglecta]|uniref:Uncharacterized protein n=1 Tax=Lepraria neglecta TaxID=209136 RepID=A0AAD9Z7R8_9LECA|nr:hypothetical protein OEA41_006449 [Lepraria neglecta]
MSRYQRLETLTEHAYNLVDALKGYGIMKPFSKNLEWFEQTDCRPTLPPDLRQQIESTLMAMEKVVVELNLEIEQNQFRLRRGDPRGQYESVLAVKRDLDRGSWDSLLGELVGRVRAFYTEVGEVEEMWRAQEERTLREGGERE